MRKLLPLFVVLFSPFYSHSQDFSNKGKDFWLGYGYHVRYVTGNPVNGQDMVLYFATDAATTITINIPAVGYTETIVAPANSIVESQPIPKSGTQDARLTAEGLYNTGIHVTSDKPVVAYAHIYNGNVSGATLLFPTNTLGKEYYSINYNQVSNEPSSNSFFFVVAADTGTTTVEITPTVTTQLHTANVPFIVSLTQGQIYNVMGELTGGSTGAYTGGDLTGSKIRSLSSGTISCKRIGVFSGSGKIKISCNSSNSSDNLFAQAFPKNAWGKKFLTTPTKNMDYNYFRVAVSDPTTVVKVNGVTQSGLVNNFYYDLPITNLPKMIEADKPIMVAQYITTANSCGNTVLGSDGDPEMIYLSPVEQTIDEVILNSTYHAAITQHWINIVIKANAANSVLLDGASVASSFVTHPADPTFKYAQISVAQGGHKIEADSGFNAIAYGYGNAESYGYNAGTNLKDLYTFIAPQNPLNISGISNIACACTPFYFTITYPFQPISLFWNFHSSTIPNVTINSPVPDSTFFINGKQVWQYKLPTPYTYCPAGDYPVSITAGTTSSEGCGNFQTRDDTLFVRNTPVTNFDWTSTGCVTDSVAFNDNTFYETGTYYYIWNWDFGDGTVSHLHFPKHKYATPGTYNVKFSIVTNIGCISDTLVKSITVTNNPLANFSVTSPLCSGKPITFNDLSTTQGGGNLANWYWDFGDGTLDTTTTNTGITHTYTSSGTEIASLVVGTVSGCKSSSFPLTFQVKPNPLVNFPLPGNICLPYQSAHFADASTIADGSSPVSWLWDFGEPASGAANQATTATANHLYSSTGPFTVNLQVTSNAGCVGNLSQIVNTVYPQPTASFTYNPENCLNDASHFTSTSNPQGNTITHWFWNFGDGTPVANGVVPDTSHVYGTVNNYIVKHWIITDKGCLSDTSSQTIVVNALPVPDFSFTAPACQSRLVTFTDHSATASGNIIKWIWNFGDGQTDTALSNAPLTHTYTSSGTYTVTLEVLTDKGCRSISPRTKIVIVNPPPVAGFISPLVCLSDAFAQFIDTSSIASGSTIASWSWNFGDPSSGINNTSNQQNPQHKYNDTGHYVATVIVTSNFGCIDTVAQSFTVNGSVPLANFTILNPANLCSNDTVSIKDGSTVDFGYITKVEIYWDNVGAPTVFQTDNSPAPGKIYQYLYPDFQAPATKSYTIRYRAYSGATCVNDLLQTVVVKASPKVQFNIIPSICLDANPYQITEAFEVGNTPLGSAQFSGTGVTNAGLFNPLVAGPGVHSIHYTFTSNAGCFDSASQVIKVWQPVVDSFTFSSPTCEGSNVTFTDHSISSEGTITDWIWNFGDGSNIEHHGVNPFTHTYVNSGTYTVQLTTVTSNGCNKNYSRTIVIDPQPKPLFGFTPSCIPVATVQFTDSSKIANGTQNAFTYLWNFGDVSSGNNNTSIAKNPTHYFSTTGPYAITLTVTSNVGCVNSITIMDTIIHPKPIADFTSDSISLCIGQSVQFIDRSNGIDGVINQWIWNFGDGQTSFLQFPPTHTYVDTLTYQVSLHVQNNFGCKADTVKNFVVYPYPVVDAGPDEFVFEGGRIVLFPTVSGNGLTYLWTSNPIAATTDINDPTILYPTILSPVSEQTYFTLSVTGTGGCMKSDSMLLTLLHYPVIPNTITPNGDGRNDVWVIPHLETYPNCRVQIFNRYGQLMFESKKGYTTPWDGTYNGKTCPEGTYYYIIEPGYGLDPMKGYITIIK